MTTPVAAPTSALPVPDPAAVKHAKAPIADIAIARTATIATHVRLLKRFISFVSSFPFRGVAVPRPSSLGWVPLTPLRGTPAAASHALSGDRLGRDQFTEAMAPFRRGAGVDPGNALRRPAGVGDRAARVALERSGRSARPEIVDARRGRLRRRGVERAHRRAEAARRLAGRRRAPRGRAGRAQSASK